MTKLTKAVILATALGSANGHEGPTRAVRARKAVRGFMSTLQVDQKPISHFPLHVDPASGQHRLMDSTVLDTHKSRSVTNFWTLRNELRLRCD